jgi:hypothetical protein
MSAQSVLDLAVDAAAPGGFFKTIDFLATLEALSEPAVQRVLEERIASAQAAGPRIVAQLERAGHAAAAQGLTPGPLPRVPAEYYAWFARLDAQASAFAGFALGRRIGEASATLFFLNELLIVSYQLGATGRFSPEIAAVLERLAALAGELPESDLSRELAEIATRDWLAKSAPTLAEELAPIRAAHATADAWVARLAATTRH